MDDCVLEASTLLHPMVLPTDLTGPKQSYLQTSFLKKRYQYVWNR
jgi:hypothetical protein